MIYFAKLLLPEGRHILNHTEIITWSLWCFLKLEAKHKGWHLLYSRTGKSPPQLLKWEILTNLELLGQVKWSRREKLCVPSLIQWVTVSSLENTLPWGCLLWQSPFLSLKGPLFIYQKYFCAIPHPWLLKWHLQNATSPGGNVSGWQLHRWKSPFLTLRIHIIWKTKALKWGGFGSLSTWFASTIRYLHSRISQNFSLQTKIVAERKAL